MFLLVEGSAFSLLKKKNATSMKHSKMKLNKTNYVYLNTPVLFTELLYSKTHS